MKNNYTSQLHMSVVCTLQKVCNKKKRALTRVQRPTPALFLWLVTLTFDPKINGFQDSSWNICMLSLVILAASVIKTSCGKTHTDKQRWKPYHRKCHQRRYL